MTAEQRKSLYDYLAHGDAAHREWLREAIEAFFANKPRPVQK